MAHGRMQLWRNSNYHSRKCCLQAHIPYRNHKLTMLMSDSLGGTAKTLMFVNVSPTDSNLDETQTSLQVCPNFWCLSIVHVLQVPA